MAPPSAYPRLYALSADTLVDALAGALANHLAHLATAVVNPTGPLSMPGVPYLRTSKAAQDLRALHLYALTGADEDTLNPEQAAENAKDRLATLSVLLQACAWDYYDTRAADGTANPGPMRRGEPLTGVGVLILAAWARAKIDSSLPVAPRELAALCSIGLRTVETALADGEIVLAPDADGIPPHRARKWAHDAGVSGL